MKLPVVQTFPLPSVLRVKVRPSTKYPDIAVGEYIVSIPDLSVGVGLEVRFNKDDLAKSADPMDLVLKSGCQGVAHFLRDAMVAYTEKVRAEQDMTADPPAESAESTPSTDVRVHELETQLADLQARYDAREMAGWGISNA
jgi:hypothetical protein